MRRVFLGIVPDDCLDDEEKVRTWAREKVAGKKLSPTLVGLSPTHVYQGDERKRRVWVTAAEAFCEPLGRHKCHVTYAGLTVDDYGTPLEG